MHVYAAICISYFRLRFDLTSSEGTVVNIEISRSL